MTPVIDLLARTAPLRPGEVAWRFGALGMAFSSLVTPLLGVFLALAVAVFIGQRRLARGISVVSFALAAALLLALGAFALDFVQVRAGLGADAQAGVDAAALRALVLGFAGAVAAALIGLGGWQAAARLRRAGPDQQRGEVGLVVTGRRRKIG